MFFLIFLIASIFSVFSSRRRFNSALCKRNSLSAISFALPLIVGNFGDFGFGFKAHLSGFSGFCSGFCCGFFPLKNDCISDCLS